MRIKGLANFKIEHDDNVTTVLIDGQDVSMKCSKVVFEHEAGCCPTVTITYSAGAAEVVGSAMVKTLP